MQRVKILILVFLILVTLACTDAEALFGKEMAAEIEAEIDAYKDEAKDQLKDSIDGAVDDLKEGVKEGIEEKVDELKDDTKDSLQQLVPSLPFACSNKKITDNAIYSPWGQISSFPNMNSIGKRSSGAYGCVIDQFDVEHSYTSRYKPQTDANFTRCNIFAADVMRAMSCPLPTKGQLGKGASGSKNTDKMTAVPGDIYYLWLLEEKDGWSRIAINDPQELNILLDHLKDGKPALAATDNHIAVLRPDHLPKKLTMDNLMDLHIAQAGAYNYNDKPLNIGSIGVFGNSATKTFIIPDFFIHE